MENQSFDRLLRAAPAGMDSGVTTPDCFDAETLAAWMEGHLAGPERARAEKHLAGCARCQAMLAAMARSEDAAALAAGTRPRSRLWSMLPWAAPLTAAATAAALWLAVRPDLARRPATIDADRQVAAAQGESPAASPPPAAPPSSAADTTADVVQPAKPAESGARLQSEERPAKAPVQESAKAAGRRDAREERQSQTQAFADLEVKRRAEGQAAVAPPGAPVTMATPPPPVTPVASPPAAPAAPAPAQTERVLPRTGFVGDALKDQVTSPAPVVVASPDRKAMWRIGDGPAVHHSSDGGATWTTVTIGPTAILTAGAAPSASVCWIVGRAGSVFLTVDGRTWRAVAFPEAVDLVAIRASSADEASVTTADRRTFSTKDGGKTWTPSIR